MLLKIHKEMIIFQNNSILLDNQKMQQAWNDLTATVSKNKVKSLVLTNSNFALLEYISDFIRGYLK